MNRARRALLFVPGTEARKIEKAAQSAADAVILDLEDAAALDQKPEARRVVCDALARVDFRGRERIVRLNPLGGGLDREDLEALEEAAAPPDALLVPKAEEPEELRRLSRRLEALERRHGLAPGTIRLLALIETARGVVALREIAAADPRLDALVFGAEDLAGDVGAIRTPAGDEVFVARSLVALHAAAAKLAAIDTPYLALQDAEGLLADTRKGLELGYSGRLAIHPNQLAPILATFTPTADEVAAAKRLIEAHDRHQAEGRGVFSLDGKMVDMPLIRAARRVLARAGG